MVKVAQKGGPGFWTKGGAAVGVSGFPHVGPRNVGISFRRRAFAAALTALAVTAALAAAPAVAHAATSPHETTFGSRTCGVCHALHQASTQHGIFRASGAARGEIAVCMTCHDGSGASSNVATGPASFGQGSGHVLEGRIDTAPVDITNACSDCHTPHVDPSADPKLPAKTVNGVAVEGAGNAWCLACHDDEQSWYASRGAYPSVAMPARDASGYPVAGTFPGASVYASTTANPHALIPAASGTTTRTAGDCRYCHGAHSTPSRYDSLLGTLTVPSASSVASDLATGSYASACFACHGGGSWASKGATDVKRNASNLATATGLLGGTGGHRIKSAGASLPVDAPLPCYDCHNPHGSSRGNRKLIADTLGASLDTSAGPEGVRKSCLSCHTTSEGLGWDSAAKTYAAPSDVTTVSGLLRNGGAPDSGPAGAVGHGPGGNVNWLRLRTANGHGATDTGRSCYDCHGSAYTSAGSYNIHQPRMFDAATHTSVGGVDFISAGMSNVDHGMGDGAWASCSDCHTMNLLPLHMNDCQACHGSDAPMTVKTAVANHDTACTTCHPSHHEEPNPDHEAIYYSCDCHELSPNWDDPTQTCSYCHGAWTPGPNPSTTSDAQASYITQAIINLSVSDAVRADGSRNGAGGIQATYYSLDGTPAVTGAQIVVPAPPIGTESHTLRFWSTDWTGNTEATHTVMFTVAHDVLPPTTTSNVIAGKTYAGDQTFTLSATDQYASVAGTYWSLDSTTGPWNTGTSIPVSAPLSGTTPHTLYFYSTDTAGNVEATRSVGFSVLAGRDFAFTGAEQTFVVPAGVTTISVTLDGGGGGKNYWGVPLYLGGAGGRTTSVVPVSYGQVFTIRVGGLGMDYLYGGDGQVHTIGAWPNGGNGGLGNTSMGGGAGGGSSQFVLGTAVLLEAGGGGGAGTNAGGAGGSAGTGMGGNQRGGNGNIVGGGGGGGWAGGSAGNWLTNGGRGGFGGTSYIATGTGSMTAGYNAGAGAVTIRYSATGYVLTYLPGPNGTISGVTPQNVAAGGNGTFVTAVGNTGYHFVNWSDGSTANPRQDTNVNANKTVTANFAWSTFSLTYAPGANGSVVGTTSQVVNYGSSGTTVTAVPDANYHFVSWSDGSTANPRRDVNVTGNVAVTANFSYNATHTVTYTPGANGSLSGAATQTVAWQGSGTAVTAVPNTGYHFVNWSDGSTGNPRSESNVTSDLAFTANFGINSYALRYAAGANGTLSGATSQTVTYGGSGTPVTATANTGYHFVNWSDGSTANPRTETNVAADTSVTANFAINTYMLTYSAGMNGSVIGTTTQVVNHGGTGTSVTAVGDPGFHFVSWSDGSTANPRTDTNVTANRSVTASFAIDVPHTVTYSAGTNGSLSGVTTQTVPWAGSTSAVTAVADTGYAFLNWSDGSTANPRTDTNVTTDISVTANFTVQTFPIYTYVNGNGSITPNGTVSVPFGASQTFTMTANTNYRVACYQLDWDSIGGWRLPASSYTFTNVTTNHSIYAYYAASNTRTVVYTYGANGYANPYGPQFIVNGSSGTSVTALPNTGYHFTNWSDGSTANPRRDSNVASDAILTPSFAPNTYTFTYTAGANGTMTGSTTQSVLYGSAGTTVTAVANGGYHFLGWSDGVLTASRKDACSGALSVTAIFNSNANYDVTYSSGVEGYISGNQLQSVAPGASGTTVTAVPNDARHWEFSYWSDDVGNLRYDNPLQDTNVTKNVHWTAHYYNYFTGSCPFLFTWDGLGFGFGFESDLFSTGKLGAVRSSGGYQKPNPNDYYITENQPAPIGGRLEMRLVEERAETDYMDQVRLFAVDLPWGTDIVAEKIPAGGAYKPLTDIVHTVSSRMRSVNATHVEDGTNISHEIAAPDGLYATLNPDAEAPATQTIELDLGDLSAAQKIKLVMEGNSWTPDTDEGRAIAAGIPNSARQTIQVVGTDGQWHQLPGTWPKPAEFARPYVLDLTGKFPTNDYRVRLTFVFKTCVDSIQLDTTPDQTLQVTEAPLASAELGHHGFDAHDSPNDIFKYVYGVPTEASAYMPGLYTRFGDVTPLLWGLDDKFVIFGGGDEVTLRFDEPPAAPAGTTRRWVVYANGYYKWANTDIPLTVDPLPFAAMSNYPYPATESYPADPDHQQYIFDWNTRYEGP